MIESRMTNGSPDYKKRLVSIKVASVTPPSAKGDLVTFGGKASNAAEFHLATKLANDINGVKGVKMQAIDTKRVLIIEAEKEDWL
jgi:hypothetical protein